MTAKTAMRPIGPQTKVSSVLNEDLFLPPGDTARDPSAQRGDFPCSNARIAYPLEIYPSAEYRFAATRRFRLDEVGCARRMRRETLESLRRHIQSDASLSSGYTTDSDGSMGREARFAGETPWGSGGPPRPLGPPDPVGLNDLAPRSDRHERRTNQCGRRRTENAG
jgi:hypothetical protein